MDKRKPLQLSTDILVIGGGAAGLSAAVAAARNGHSVTLVEKYGFCGGGAVAGLSGTICGLYEAFKPDQVKQQQVVYGFAQEFITALESKNGLASPVKYGNTYTRVHDPLVWRNISDAFLKENNIKVIYHATVIGAITEGDEILGALITSKQGIIKIDAKITIDASGDADLIAMAGLPSFIGDKGKVQNPTMMFRLLGVDIERFISKYGENSLMSEAISSLIYEQHQLGKYCLPRAKIFLFPTTRPGELLCNCTRVIGPDGRELNPLFFNDFTDAEIEGRSQVQEYARFFKDNLVGCESAFINDTGVQVGVRQTRQVEGLYKLTNKDVVSGQKFRNGIARSPWPIELHSGNKPRVEWLYNDFYEIPYECFVPKQGNNILVAGRCLSAEHEAVASARVTAQCFGYGQAVGEAASLCVQESMQPKQIQGHELRSILNQKGAQLDS